MTWLMEKRKPVFTGIGRSVEQRRVAEAEHVFLRVEHRRRREIGAALLVQIDDQPPIAAIAEDHIERRRCDELKRDQCADAQAAIRRRGPRHDRRVLQLGAAPP